MAEEIINNGSFIQSVIEQQLNEDILEFEEEKLDFNPLKVYFGDDYILNDRITIHQPSIQDFIEFGEENINRVVAPFSANTTAYRVQLWDIDIDWNKITNMDLINLLFKTIDFEYSKLIFGDINFNTFNIYEKTYNGETTSVLYSEEADIEIDEKTLSKMCKYIQYMFATHPPEEEFVSNKTLKQELINNDRQKQLKWKKENRNQNMLSMISSCLNHPGFKYKKNELRNVGIFEFMDSVQRLQIYEQTHSLLLGRFNGLCDLSKVNKDEFNFMRDIRVTA